MQAGPRTWIAGEGFHNIDHSMSESQAGSYHVAEGWKVTGVSPAGLLPGQ